MTYDMPPIPGGRTWDGPVTDVPCPVPGCTGTVRWAEAGNVPGWRECDGCRTEFQADGTADRPTLTVME